MAPVVITDADFTEVEPGSDTPSAGVSAGSHNFPEADGPAAGVVPQTPSFSGSSLRQRVVV